MAQAPTAATESSDYVLGHATGELDRLIEQASFFGDLTQHVLQLAGLKRGMHVLDLGCGPGDVSFLAARLVGLGGSVIGVDTSAEAIGLARERARSAGVTNVRFIVEDAAELTLAAPVDALIGRLVLLYFPDPAAVIRRLLRYLKPGGIVAFHEMDMPGFTSEPYCDILEATVLRIIQTFQRAGINPRTGLKLRRIFLDAGLAAPAMIQGARVEAGPDSPVYAVVADIVRTLLPLMERTGVATAAEIDIDTLAARARDDVVARDAVVIPPPFIGAWIRKSLD